MEIGGCTIIIVDLNQILYATLFRHLNDYTNEDINEDMIRHMALNSIRAINQKFKQKYGELVIATDGNDYWRKQSFPYYKAVRKKARDKSGLDWTSLFKVMSKIRDEIKECFPYRVIHVEKAEADDIIATLCKKYGVEIPLAIGEKILIVSGDKDFIQLQKYSNVEQFDNVRKTWVEHNNPEHYLIEHVLRGDVGDGIPNYLSDDDTFVMNKRQKRLTTQKVQEFIENKNYHKTLGEKQLRNYHRNLCLIDLTKIPEDVEKDILKEFDSQKGKGKDKIFNYFISHKLKNLMESIADF